MCGDLFVVVVCCDVGEEIVGVCGVGFGYYVFEVVEVVGFVVDVMGEMCYVCF